MHTATVSPTCFMLKALFHPAFLARVVFWFAFVVAIFMGHENGDKQRPTKRRHVQGMLDETEPLTLTVLFVLNFRLLEFLLFTIANCSDINKIINKKAI